MKTLLLSLSFVAGIAALTFLLGWLFTTIAVVLDGIFNDEEPHQ